MANKPVIHAEKLVKTYHVGTPVHALRGVDLEIEAGELVAIMGSSGSGKSTLMNVLGCLDKPTSGTYRLDGVEVSSLSADQLADLRNERIGFVFQGFNLLPRMSLQDNVALPLVYAGVDKETRRAKARELLDKVGLGRYAESLPARISGGQQQRVAIARALMQEPKVILADEPIASLDPMNAQIVMDTLRRIHDEDGITVVANLHTLDTARRYCDRVIGMRDGRVVFDGKPAELSRGVARDIYGADETFSEEATSTSLEHLGREGDDAFAEAMLT